MRLIGTILGILYLLCMIIMFFFGLNNLVITGLFAFTKSRLKKEKPAAQPKVWPRVTVQLPVFNERYVFERLLRAVTKLDYPADRLQIQVLDDSTDDTALIPMRLEEVCRNRGVHLEYIHRTKRTGYKAGALKNGMETATGELLAIFDADFIPPPDWLKQTVPSFADPNLGCVQTRCGHVNRDFNLLTRVQALVLDAHYIVEQTTRSRNHIFMNFNGTAGIWRRTCIEDAGNWQSDTLTEDFDLSFRAQLCGWRIGYLPDVIVPGELPGQVEAFKNQQFRWAKGSIQVARKLWKQLLIKSDIPWYKRLTSFLHITGYMVFPVMMVMFLLTLPVGLLAPRYLTLFPLSLIAAFGPPLLYALAGGRQTPSLAERLGTLPLITIIGLGISLSASIALIEGWIGKGKAFVRTPKFNLTNKPGPAGMIDLNYSQTTAINPIVWGEIGLSIYALITIAVLKPLLGWAIVPWMGIYWLGYFSIASLNLIQNLQTQISSPRIKYKQQV